MIQHNTIKNLLGIVAQHVCTCSNSSIFINKKVSLAKLDPTRTTTLRKKFITNFNKRFKKLKQDIKISIIDNDCFGLKIKPRNPFINQSLSRKVFAFDKNPEKVENFMDWLKDQNDLHILEVTGRNGNKVTSRRPWMDMYVESSYKKGMHNAYTKLEKEGHSLVPPGYQPDINATLLNAPIHADAMALAYTRSFNDLKNITDAMDGQISRVLAKGLADGIGMYELADSIVREVNNIGLRRARVLARTEVVKAFNDANINVYREAGIKNVKVDVEWKTAGFGVCLDCADMAGRIFTLDEIQGVIPLHPNCRCALLPVTDNDPSTYTFDEDTIGKEYRKKDGTLRKKRGYYKKIKGKNPPSRRTTTAITKQQEREAFRNNKIEKQVKLKDAESGINATYKVKIKDDGQGFYKPLKGEVIPSIFKNAFGENPQLYKNEVAASIVDKYLNVNMVPETVLKKARQGIGSVQMQINAVDYAKFKGTVTPVEKLKLTFLDAVIGNIDRHAGNVMVDKLNKLIAIDNGFAFPLNKYYTMERSVIAEQLGLFKTPAPFIKALKMFRKNKEKVMISLKDLLSKQQIDDMFLRVDAFIKNSDDKFFIDIVYGMKKLVRDL